MPADMTYKDWKNVYIDKTKTLQEWEKSDQPSSPTGVWSAILAAEKKVTDIQAEISIRQKKIDDLEEERNNISTIAEASAITRKQQVLGDEIQELKKKLEDAIDNLAAQKNIEKYGNPYGFKKIEGKHTRRHDLRSVNPNLAQGQEWQNNCQRCTVTYELRRRGYDVTALPLPLKDDLQFNWAGMFKNPVITDCPGLSFDDCRQVVENKMTGFGDGARAIVAILRVPPHPGHVFIAEQIKGRTYFLEPQTGIWYKPENGNPFELLGCIPGQTQICRIDNLEFNQRIRECAEDRK